MPRYIDADTLIEVLKSLQIYVGIRSGKGVMRALMTEYAKSVWRIVDEQPTADVVEVVRCKDCDVPHNKWTFARTHQPGTREEFLKIPYEDTRFCPVCGREIEKLREVSQEEYARSVKGEWDRKENRS